METLELKTVSNISPELIDCLGSRTPAFTANGKIYVYDCGNLIYELDPAYFEY